MLLIFVLSAKSTKYTKLNRVLKFLRLQYWYVYLSLPIISFFFFQNGKKSRGRTNEDPGQGVEEKKDEEKKKKAE